jgi:hypothetical protein
MNVELFPGRHCLVCESRAVIEDRPKLNLRAFTCPEHGTYTVYYGVLRALPESLEWDQTRRALGRGLKWMAAHGQEATLLDERSVMMVISRGIAK